MKITGDNYKQLEKLVGDTISDYALSELDRLLAHIKSDVDVRSIGTRFLWDIYYSIDRERRMEWGACLFQRHKRRCASRW